MRVWCDFSLILFGLPANQLEGFYVDLRISLGEYEFIMTEPGEWIFIEDIGKKKNEKYDFNKLARLAERAKEVERKEDAKLSPAPSGSN